ncbi:MAG: metallophosphatase family protein [Candidatus Omnitrophica bacterium]|nr:metallophosphatase family protein [Candidatus Omnitrophota bacterium]
MKIGIISDIHSNLEAFEVSLSYLEKNKVDKILICGDIIGYGPNPKECINLSNKIGASILRGNHEQGIIENDFSRFKQYAKITIEWTVKEIGQQVEEIKKWKDKEVFGDFWVVHASISDLFYKYIIKIEDTKEEFEKLENKICFIGHTHIPCVFKKNIETGETEKILADFSGKIDLKLEDKFKYIINVGSVGFPRDGLPFPCIGIYYYDEKFFKLDRLEYNFEKTLKKVIEKGLPSKIGSFLKGF